MPEARTGKPVPPNIFRHSRGACAPVAKGLSLIYSVKFYVTALTLLFGSFLIPTGDNFAAAADRQTFILGRNQVYQTRYHVFDSGAPGPKVLLQSGIHGDEVAGIFALEQILPGIKVHTGKLIILPRMNPPAILLGRRYFNLDLNRVFPGLPMPQPYEYALAREIYDLVKNQQIEYVLTLHESKNIHNIGRAKTFGQTIIYGVEPPPRMIWAWLQAVNKKLNFDEKFCHYYCPQEDGCTDIIVRRLNLKGGFAVETWRAFDLFRRIEMQKLVVLTFFKLVGLEFSSN
jgi:uncharacterized protein